MTEEVESPPTLAAAAPAALWRNRDYMLLWGGQMVSTLGSGISQLAFPLLILAITGSPARAGLAGFLYSLPYVVLSLPAGALIDRWDRKRVMVLADLGRMVNAFTIPLAAALGHLSLAQLYANTVVEGTLFVFFNIAEVACLSRVVPKVQLPNAAAQNDGGTTAMALISPPLGGALYQISRSVPFLVDAVSYAVSVLSLLCIRTSFQEQRVPSTRALKVEIAEGIAWLWHQPLIRYVAFLTGGLNLVGAGTGLILIVIARNQHAPAAAIGLIFSIGSIGGILGALVAPRIQKRVGFGRAITAILWANTVIFPLYLAASNVVLLGVVSALLFVTGPIYNAVQFSYRISLIPDALQGRVNSAFRLLAFGFMPIGSALCGVLLETAGATTTILLLSAITLGLAVTTTLNPRVRNARPSVAAAA